MKMFKIDKWVWDKFPGMVLVCLAGAVDNKHYPASLHDFYAKVQESVKKRLGGKKADSVEAFAVWREAQPSRNFPAAHEALGVRVASGNTLRSINPLVDLYNGASLALLSQGIAAPIGAWDSDQLPTLRLTETQGGEKFRELGKSEEVEALPGEISYATPDGETLVTRHFVWRQSQLGAVSSSTDHFFMVSELIEPFADKAKEVEGFLSGLLAEHLGAQVQTSILAEGDTAWNWEEQK